MKLTLWLSFWLLVVPAALLARALGVSSLRARQTQLPGGGTTYFVDIHKQRSG